MTGKTKLSEAQWKMLDVLDRSMPVHLPVSIGNLVDEDFCDLIERDLIGMHRDGPCWIGAFITHAGRAILNGEKE